MLSEILGGFVVLVIGTTLIPTVANLVVDAQCGGNQNLTDATCNVSGTSSTVVGLTTLFYALAVMTTALAIAAQGLRSSGIV